MNLGEAARAAGGCAWAERSLFEAVGRWVPTCESAAAKLYFDAASQHHAWRAQLWEDQLAGRLVQAYGGQGPGRDDVLRPFSEAGALLVKALGSLDGDVERAAAHVRVALARSLYEYRRWAERLSPASDAPVARAISLAAADASADWAAGGALLADLLEQASGDGPTRAAGACAEVERLVVGQGLVFGG